MTSRARREARGISRGTAGIALGQAAAAALMLSSLACAALAAGGADPAGDGADAPAVSLPQSGLFSSFKQAVKQGYDHEAIRGYFEQGTPPNAHRYYCLVDIKKGQKETNGVLGKPVPLPSGMTGIEVESVSLFLCADAEREGILHTDGFVLNGTAARANQPARAAAQAAPAAAASTPAAAAVAPAAPASTAAATPATAALPPPAPPAALAPSAGAPSTASAAMAAAAPPAPGPTPAASSPVPVAAVDVAGIKLGMSAEEVRAALRSKKLREYRESGETLSTASGSGLANGRFVNVIAAWSAPPGGGDASGDGESYEVMFTPVPGREPPLAVVHTLGYSPANAPRESALESALAKKYGGAGASPMLPSSPTWRLGAGGTMESGDACGRRGTIGGLAGLSPSSARENLSLKLGEEELRHQAEHCGAAIITEDQLIANAGALRDDRTVARFTVTAFSPSIALEGAKAAAQLIRAASGDKSTRAQPRPGAPEL